MGQQIEIVKQDHPFNPPHVTKYARDVYVDGELRGRFFPFFGEFNFRDLGGASVGIKGTANVWGQDRFYKAYVIADMESVVEKMLEAGVLPTKADVKKREAKARRAEKKAEAEEAEAERVWKIKEHAEELLEALERLVGFADGGHDDAGCHKGICSRQECSQCQRVDAATAVIAKAKGEV